MDEAQEILLKTLRSSGISLPSDLSSIKDLTSACLVSICAQFLLLIDGSSLSFPTSLPSSMAERFKICEEMASAIKALGYRRNLGFHQFLYPSEEDSYNLVRFLVEKLSDSLDGRKNINTCAKKPHSVLTEDKVDISGGASNQTIDIADGAGESQRNHANQISKSVDRAIWSAISLKTPCLESFKKERAFSEEAVKGHLDESHKEVLCSDGDFSQIENKFVAEAGKKLASLQEQLFKLRYVVHSLQSEEKTLIDAKHLKTVEVQKLEHESEILKVALDMAFNDRFSAEYFLHELDEQVESKRNHIMELETQWTSVNQTPEEGKMTHELSSHKLESGLHEKHDQLKQTEHETESTLSEIHRRELEYSELLEELQMLPKLPPRKSYVQRITEITKNSWKQDADINRIIRETRELQLESNYIRERFDRTYAVVDETVFREAKKDAVGRQVYRLLTSIHDNFEQIGEKIMATDRARREAAEQEAKLTALSSRSIDINKLQADLDSIRKENELLEQQLCQNQPLQSI